MIYRSLLKLIYKKLLLRVLMHIKKEKVDIIILLYIRELYIRELNTRNYFENRVNRLFI